MQKKGCIEFKLKIKYCIKEKENSLVYVHTNFMINSLKKNYSLTYKQKNFL